MEQYEFEYWQAVTASSTHNWVEDHITRHNGNGNLFYFGGENGIYMRISPDSKLTVGTYEGAYPHIGEAIFTIQTERQYSDYNGAFEAACKLGGQQFLADMFSQDSMPPSAICNDEPETNWEMTMR